MCFCESELHHSYVNWNEGIWVLIKFKKRTEATTEMQRNGFQLH